MTALYTSVFLCFFFFSVFEKDQLTKLCKNTISKLGSNFENISGLGWAPEKSQNFSDDVVWWEASLSTPPPLPHPHSYNKQKFIKMTNLLILRLSSVVKEFLLTG